MAKKHGNNGRATPRAARRHCAPSRRLLVLLSAALAGAAAPAPAAPSGGAAATGASPPGSYNVSPDQFMNYFTTHLYVHRDYTAGPSYVYFPPVPPALESEIPVLAPFDTGPAAPAELQPFVSEIFYPYLGARMYSGDLPKPIRSRIVAYRDAKLRLQDELLSVISALKDADAATGDARLSQLAARQDGAIRELQGEAEAIRTELRPSGLLGINLPHDDPSDVLLRRVHSVRDAPTEPAGMRQEAEALRGAAYFQDGLSREGRGLLLESAMKLAERGNLYGEPAQARRDGRLLYFSPETARITIPADLAQPLKGQVDEYTALKESLEAELRDALSSMADESPAQAKEAMARLASAQAERVARVQNLAEEIRRGLAALPNPPGPPPPPSLPSEIAARIAEYRRQKVALLKALRSLLAVPTPAADPGAAEAPANPAASSLAWMHDDATHAEVQSSQLRVSVAEFDHRQNELLEALNRDEAGIRASLAAYERATNGPSDRKSVNDLLKDFEEARQREEIWERYRDYQTAALLPGLSALQRQLIFDASIEHLDLPLPAGETVP